MTELSIRPYRPEDEAEVLRLLAGSLGGGPAGERSAGFFQWKHAQNPFGGSYIVVGEAEGRIVGLRALMRWAFRAGDRSWRAVRAVDTATHPDYRGRGVFSALTLAALEALEGEVDFVFNTPNQASGAGYVKMGWRMVGRPRVGVRVRRPIRFLRGLRSLSDSGPPAGRVADIWADPASEALADEAAVGALLSEAQEADSRLHTPKDVAFLRWRYADAPGLGYRAVRLSSPDGLRGLALFRVRPRRRLWECGLAELIVPAGDRGTAGKLLQRVLRAVRVDHVTCLLPPGSTARRAATRRGFIPSPGPVLMARPLREDILPDPTDLAAWAVSLGDLEVF